MLAALMAAICSISINATDVSTDCDDCRFRVALKTNLLHDALLTPDIGIELSIAKRWSISAEGVWAWLSNDSRHRYWRVYGGWIEARRWLGNKTDNRALTGHHVGIYGSALSYDFEFGGKGWQSPSLTYGIGASYGYSFRIAPRLNLDLSLRAGYSAGKLIKYRPQCGTYVCYEHGWHRYFGLTGVEVTLVWFPGKRKANHPEYSYGL